MGLNILVVDDASFVRDTIKRTIRQMAADIHLFDAIDGKKAVSVMKANQIDLILSDWEMPEMSGEELLQWVRSHPSYYETPFIMVTSRGDRNHVILAVKAGVNDYLTKPFTPEELKHKLAKQFKKMGYSPKRSRLDQATHASSVDVLTGGATKAKLAGATQQKNKVVVAAGFGKPKPAAKPKPAPVGNFTGKAVLRFAKSQVPLEVREVSLQALAGTMPRPESVPSVFDQAAVDLVDKDGNMIGRLNAYIHSVQATEPRPECKLLRVTVRFVDNDPAKFEALSKAIT
ncbi:response regulator [Teredinibacter sp. KSP-S5-2]|uniref:response regulator n=1 Tax=Teredinibacter sp. KSP-S5-2 TaxID=3034506 RepID=UPI002934429D|nr:response regulator [Teredinibacter sp. KSP-S5-2]WNO09268.1 response regulator [Teredinibacter sp. KSP-S5-2]